MHCPLCSAASSFAFLSKHAEVAKCDNCGHLFAVARQPGSGVQSLEDHGTAFTDYRERDARLVRRLFRDGALRKGARALDIGSGTGHIASAMRSAGVDVVCVEADPASVVSLRAQGFQSFDRIEGVGGPFDVISMVEVIEHMDDPLTELRKLRPLLKRGSTLFLTTPCGETRSGSRKTNAYDADVHVQFFTERSLAGAVIAAGFGPFQFVTMNEVYPHSSALKDVVRTLRARILGPHHLIGYAKA